MNYLYDDAFYRLSMSPEINPNSIGVLTFFGAFLLIYFLFFFVLIATMYALTASSYYVTAKKLGLASPSRAFIPIYNIYYFGKMADDASRRNGTKNRSFAAKLLTFNLIGIGGYSVLLPIFYIGMAINQRLSASFGMVAFIFVFLFAFVAIYALLIASAVYHYMALYQIFKCFDESNAVIWLVLSIFISLAQPILLFVLSRKEPKAYVYNAN